MSCVWLWGRSSLNITRICNIFHNTCTEFLCDLFCCVKHYISLSSLCKSVWKHWITEMLVRYMLSGVSNIKSIPSFIFHSVYMCVSSAQFFCDDRLLSSSNRKYELLTTFRIMSWQKWYTLYVVLCSYVWFSRMIRLPMIAWDLGEIRLCRLQAHRKYFLFIHAIS